MVVLIVAVMAFAVFKPIRVLPRLRPAPGYSLTDEHGLRFTSEDTRGAITLYTFVPFDCGQACDEVSVTMATVRDRVAAEVDLAGVPFRLVSVVLDPDVATDALLATAASAGDVGGVTNDDWHWLTGSRTQIDNVVQLGFRRPADPADFAPGYAIVDGWGTIRGEYRYSTLLGDADKLVRHIDVLGGELRHRSALAGFAYDAAHAFQCYP